ncbi:MAG: prenyltransferase [Gemmatimonadota bacterium]
MNEPVTTDNPEQSLARGILGISRAPFLLLPITLVAAGAAASAYDDGFSWLATVLALIGLVALHVAVNAINEWSDFLRGIDQRTQRTPFSGGSGTLPAGAVSPAFALGWGLAASALGAAIGVYFILQIGASMVPIVIIGALLVLLYTHLFARLAVGEIAAGLGLGALPVAGTALVQQGSIGTAAIAAAVPAFLMTFNLLLLNEFPDIEADRFGGRRNLVLVFGRRGGALIYGLAALAVPVWIAGSVIIGALPLLALLALLPSLLLLRRPLAWAFRQYDEPVPVPALGDNVIWNLGTNTLMAVALLLTILL